MINKLSTIIQTLIASLWLTWPVKSGPPKSFILALALRPSYQIFLLRDNFSQSCEFLARTSGNLNQGSFCVWLGLASKNRHSLQCNAFSHWPSPYAEWSPWRCFKSKQHHMVFFYYDVCFCFRLFDEGSHADLQVSVFGDVIPVHICLLKQRLVHTLVVILLDYSS